ncbi:hypothetical protein BJY00DRAFT_317537 [Aspergillus carlsbadensis]|nr:hypothetical protein BJY00DRAFT_317537 [Aspergillus carlsbadensis]
MNPNNPENQDEHAGSSTPDNHDAFRRNLANLSLSQEDSNTEDPKAKDTERPVEDVEKKDTQSGASKPGERPRIYRINTLNENGDSVDDEDDDEEGSNISPDQLFGIVFNLDTPREVDLKVSIKGDFNVTILYGWDGHNTW